jgi:hypothetical protein
MFGNCFLHIKRFRDSSTTAHITSIFIRARIWTNSQSIVSIFSANETRSIKPEGRTKEGCSLNIIIGFVPSKSKLLYRFMYTNPYTYLSRPNSIYVLVVDSLRRLSFSKSFITLPTSIFVLQFPPFYLKNHIALHSSPSYFCLCLSCRVFLQPVTNNKRIRFLTEYSYQEEWKKPYMTMQALVHYRATKISRCEQNIWKKWLAPKEMPDVHSGVSVINLLHFGTSSSVQYIQILRRICSVRCSYQKKDSRARFRRDFTGMKSTRALGRYPAPITQDQQYLV